VLQVAWILSMKTACNRYEARESRITVYRNRPLFSVSWIQEEYCAEF